jgi:hypothetical protein
MQIFLKTLAATTLSVDVEPTDTIAELKRAVFTGNSAFQGMPMASFRLIFESRQLSDEKTIQGEQLIIGSTVHIVINRDKAADKRTDLDKAIDTALFAAPTSQVVWSVVYLDKKRENNNPFDRNPDSIYVSEDLSEIIEIYRNLKKKLSASRRPDMIPYVAATVMPQDWKMGLTDSGRSSDGLSLFMNITKDGELESFNRPILALYSLNAEGSSFIRIQNPLYRTEGLTTSSAMAFEHAFSSTNSSDLTGESLASSAGAGSSSNEASSVEPVAVRVTAQSEILAYIPRHIANSVASQIEDFSGEGLDYEALAEGTRLAIEALLARYQHGPVSDGQAMQFSQDLPSDLAQEICSAIAVGVEHHNTPGIPGISREQVFTSASQYLGRLQAFSFNELLDYLDITALVRMPPAPAATAGAGTSVGAGAPASVASVKAKTLLSPVASAPPVFVESVVALNPFLPSAPPVDMTVDALAQTAAAPTALVVLDVEGTIITKYRPEGFMGSLSEFQTVYAYTDEFEDIHGRQPEQIPEIDPRLLGYLRDLCALGSKIVIATGTDGEELETYRRQFDAAGIGRYISFYQPDGHDKSDSKFHKLEKYQRQFGITDPSRIYFYDDAPSNVSNAISAGFVNSFRVTDESSLADQLALNHGLSSQAFDEVSTGAATVVPPPFYSGAASGVVSAGASDAPVNHQQALKAAFVQAFMQAYRADAQGHRLFGSLGRNMSFLTTLDKISTEDLKFDKIKSHFAEGQDSKKPKRTAVVVQNLLAQDRFTGLISDFVPSHK